MPHSLVGPIGNALVVRLGGELGIDLLLHDIVKHCLAYFSGEIPRAHVEGAAVCEDDIASTAGDLQGGYGADDVVLDFFVSFREARLEPRVSCGSQ